MSRYSLFPATGAYRLTRANVPVSLLEDQSVCAATDTDSVLIDIDIGDSQIMGISRHNAGAQVSHPVIDLSGSQVWPGFIDVHTHLDKAHIWPRTENPDGTFASALQAVERDCGQYWSVQDLAARMDFALRCAYAHGTVALRTHLDSHPHQYRASWEIFCDLRQRWSQRVELQGVSLVSIDRMSDPFASEIADWVARYDGVLGAVTYMTDDLDQRLQRIFDLAAERSLDLDFHVDESLDPQAASLGKIADIALRSKFSGRIVVGHCCSLAAQDDATVDRVLATVQEAGIHVVSLPMCNLYLQDRVPGRTPRQRGATLLHEMQDRGIAVAISSDNVRDPFFAYGDLDMLEVFTQAVRIAHLDRPITAWPLTVTRQPARIMGIDAGYIRVGSKADLVICEGRSFSEVLSRPQHRRIVLRAGRAIPDQVPDYRELDAYIPSVN